MLAKSFLASVSVMVTTRKIFIVDFREDKAGSSEISNSHVVTAEEVSLMVVKCGVDPFTEGSKEINVLLVVLIIESLVHLNWVKLGKVVSNSVDGRVDQPHLLGFFGVESVLFSKHAEDSGRLIVVLAAMNPAWDLARWELTSGLARAKLFETKSLVFIVNLSMAEEDSDAFSTSVNTEVNKLAHKIFF